MNFRNYISTLRQSLKIRDSTKYVLGNSGADYDSVIGAILYAFYMTTSMKILYLPLIDCKQSDLTLRFEITTVLDSLHIYSHDLIYTDMIVNLYNKNNSFILYDHNVRSNLQDNQIEEIVDHHAYDPQKIKCNHIINHCGSALTLLYYLYYPQQLKHFQNTQLNKKYQKYFQKHKSLLHKQKIQDQQIINQMLYYGILIDTYGLSPKQTQVWTQYDKHALDKLKHTINPKFTFEQLGQAKFDTQKNLKLNFKQQQMKDYKLIIYGNFEIHYSTILLDIDVFIKRYWKQIQEELSDDKIENEQIHAFMFSFPSQGKADIAIGNFKKFILFTGKNKQLIGRIQKILAEMNFKKHEDIGNFKKWSDPTGKISRKIFDKQLKSKL